MPEVVKCEYCGAKFDREPETDDRGMCPNCRFLEKEAVRRLRGDR